MLPTYQGGHPAYPQAIAQYSRGGDVARAAGMTEVYPNSLDAAGQGKSPPMPHDDAHERNAHHGTITGHGYQYSHTTVIHRPDNSTYMHHSYNHPDHKDQVVGVSVKKNGKHQWNVHTLGSGHEYEGTDSAALSKLLRGRLSRLKKS